MGACGLRLHLPVCSRWSMILGGDDFTDSAASAADSAESSAAASADSAAT